MAKTPKAPPGPPVRIPEATVALVLHRAATATGSALMTPRQLQIVYTLAEGAPVPLRTVASILDLRKPVVTRSIDKMVQLGLTVRSKSPADGRDALLSLTPLGTMLRLALEGDVSVAEFQAAARKWAAAQARKSAKATALPKPPAQSKAA